jgi:hypothetical protein
MDWKFWVGVVGNTAVVSTKTVATRCKRRAGCFTSPPLGCLAKASSAWSADTDNYRVRVVYQ